MLDLLYPAVLIGAALIMAAAFTSVIAFRFGAPLLLIFLGVGLLAGENGLGLRFNDADAAYAVGSIALAVILFDSGFGTRLASFRQAAAPAIVLATFGVVLTMGLVGAAARLFFGFGWMEALLLGAIVSSTDAAAVFFLLRAGGIHLRERIGATLEVESGSNDPMAIFLTVMLVSLLAAEPGSGAAALTFAVGFLQQMGLGLVFGFAGGYGIVRLVNRLELDPGLIPVVVLTGALLVFSITGLLGGSGYLAVYIAGIYAGTRRIKGVIGLRRFQAGVTWLAQIVMFLVFGLLATPAQFPAILVPALALAAFLMLVARPLAVAVCLRFFNYQQGETLFTAWVGLRGAVSLLLAILPLAEGLPNGQIMFNTAFIVVMASLLVQGWTIRPLARRLGLIVPPRIGPVEKVEVELPGVWNHELVVYHIVPDSPVAQGERMPRWARPSLVVRDGQSMRLQYAGRPRAGDYVYLFTAARNTRLLDRLFASPVPVQKDDEEFYGAFVIDPGRTLGEIADAYGLVAPAHPETLIADYMLERLGGEAEVGDRVTIGSLSLIVRETNGSGAVSAAGLLLEPETSVLSSWPSLERLAGRLRALRSRLAARLRRS